MQFRPPSKNPSARNKWASIPIFKDRKEFEKFFIDIDDPIPKLLYWKDATVQQWDWVLADDGGITQVLKRIDVANGIIIKTPVGLFLNPRKKYIENIDNKERLKLPPFFMDTDLSLHHDKETLDGLARVPINARRYQAMEKKLSYDEMRFIYLVSRGMAELDAVKRVFPELANHKQKVYSLRNKPLVRKELLLEIRKVVEKLGIKDDYVYEKLKDVIENTEDDSVKYKAIVKLGEQIGAMRSEKLMIEELKVRAENAKQISSGFKGFSNDKQIEKDGKVEAEYTVENE